ncbi:Minf_1886 family protein [Humisphaera borealis]|uniref:Uncharacterized protein n=1 Tax=Humisphaera borealis TaxID=2807512 RepID=A0A7M2WQ57_9BACT|nr:Minf_1886 family protein [Humisphaera borealis]QOV87529.1 hypothetical protein IPV69_14655 [Humisphaera borealis]
MASKHQTQTREKTLEQVVADVGLYPRDAYEFVQQGLGFAAHRVHGEARAEGAEHVNRHVSGQQLCEGLREYALAQWGLLARAVLGRWNVTSTYDFGRIVFALIDAGQLQKTEDDTLDDFKAVFDFRSGFNQGYKIVIPD